MLVYQHILFVVDSSSLSASLSIHSRLLLKMLEAKASLILMPLSCGVLEDNVICPINITVRSARKTLINVIQFILHIAHVTTRVVALTPEVLFNSIIRAIVVVVIIVSHLKWEIDLGTLLCLQIREPQRDLFAIIQRKSCCRSFLFV
jgi:hypothetical protein